MTLRILGGSLKSRVLKTPSSATRPTTALLRKSIFDTLAPYILESYFLDICAGTGAMGLEALSRGAAHTTFIEKDKKAALFLRENIKNLGLEKKSLLIQDDFQKALSFLSKKGQMFDIIYVDPPYSLASFHLILLNFLEENPLLTKGGILFLEEGLPSCLNWESCKFSSLAYKQSKKFGKSIVHQLICV